MAANNAERGTSLVSRLAKSSSAYRRRAWFAMAGLALFVLLYFALAGWFAFTAWRLTFGADASGKDMFGGVIVGVCAAFLAVFMFKAIFFVKHGGTDDTIEITPAQQPQLFEFLYRLADKAGAPRPHKVFVSARVNAAVLYDLSLLNLFFPSKKNLEIGLALVNALNLGEFRAVLAHEFGHFAQRAMAVGRWVYVAQQIAAHLVARRDKLDDFLRGLSRFDLRVAWVGWLLSLIVWSIRSLVESAFNLVALMQRALSREMELQADLVAVSLTGSDALVHALHRLQAADDAWSRAVGFVLSEHANGRLTRDAFAIQTQVLARMGEILDDPDYGRVPPLPQQRAAEHRIFKAELAQPPQMWLTHPLNHEREANAKRHYVSAPIDERSAWDLFANPSALREEASAKLLGKTEAAPVAPEESIEALNKQFAREYLASRYRGVYLGRSVVRSAAHVSDLYGPLPSDPVAAAKALYPASLAEDIELLRSLEKEIGQLRSIEAGVLNPPGGVLRHRGAQLKRRELPKVIASVEAEVRAVEARLIEHDRLCRSVHLAAAKAAGGQLEARLRSLLAVLHYADHSEANVRDAQGLLANVVNVETAPRRISSSGIQRVVEAANGLHRVLNKLHAERDQVLLDAELLECLKAPSWAEALGELKLPMATRENLNDWLGAIDGWVNHTAGACGALRTNALEQLLLAEAQALAQLLASESAAMSESRGEIAPSKLPPAYDVLLPGKERKRQTRLHWWARVQTADGIGPGLVRLAVAGGIVGAVLGLGGSVGNATVTVYNGLARPVVVDVGGKQLEVQPHASRSTELAADRSYKIQARTQQGQVIESFDVDIRRSYGNFVYNVANASPLIEWIAVYGNVPKRPERRLGAPRWASTEATILFADPPHSISTKGGGGTREVLSGIGDSSPGLQLSLLSQPADQKRLILAHARWDPSNSPQTLEWISHAAELPEFASISEARLRETPGDLMLLRAEQDMSTGAAHDTICARHSATAAASPGNPDFAYLAARCIADPAAKTQAFADAHAKWPQHGWLAYASGYGQTESSNWREAIASLDQARHQVPALADAVSIDIARIRRLIGEDTPEAMRELVKSSPQLAHLLEVESGKSMDDPALQAYVELGRGRLQPALDQMARSSDGSPDQIAQRRARILRLVAASDGASAQMIDKALQLKSTEGVDMSTLWISLALAERHRRDVTAYVAIAKTMRRDQAETMLRLIDELRDELRTGRDTTAADKLMSGLPIEWRGHAYSLGVVALGPRAPKSWRDGAQRLLFASERPYFS